jgi:hypothetical protein
VPKLPPQQGWWAVVAGLLFLAHAISYLYFFVDDEGITLVYARGVLEGRGLVYAEAEGPTEGYSNFLHVMVMAGALALVGLAGLAPIWTFAAGALLSLACGAGLVALVLNTGARLGLSPLARTFGAVLLAASGPLAVWSNSSLETVPFALAFMALVAATLPDVRPGAALLAALAVMLLRIDGALYASVWMAARFAAGDTAARHALLRRAAPGVVATALVYAVARAWYYGSLLPLPLQTKVAHKFAGAAGAVEWTTRDQYLGTFVQYGGWPLLIGLAVFAAAALRPSRRHEAVYALGGAVATLAAYVGTVGDWMFGFRFFVPLLAPLALLCSYGMALAETRRRWLARVTFAGAVAWAAVTAVRFHAWYQHDMRRPSFWTVRTLDPAIKFGEYYEAYRALQPLVTAGTRLAYHEAGFVPFLLDVENVDMLGLTSRFVGSAPTADAILTDVGRYYPLTPEPPHHAVHAYLVYREPDLIVVRSTWMRGANGGRVPDAILGGHYRAEKQTSSFVIYRRTEQPIEARRLRNHGFLENLAHPAYGDRFIVNDVQLQPDDAVLALPSLWHGERHEIVADPTWSVRVDGREQAPVHEIYLEGSPPSADLRVEVSLRAGRDGAWKRLHYDARRRVPLRVHHVLEAPHPADDIEIRLTSLSGETVRLLLGAVRVMGQTDALREHLLRHGIR